MIVAIAAATQSARSLASAAMAEVVSASSQLRPVGRIPKALGGYAKDAKAFLAGD